MISVTSNAISQLNVLKCSILRVQVQGGGCAGLKYDLSIETQLDPKDKVLFDEQGVKVITDTKSFPYLFGLMMDFDGGLNGKGFTYTNPNTTGCGCGVSFSVR